MILIPSLKSQTPQLIFHSGFEPNTDTINQNSNWTSLSGRDLSVAPPNNWDSIILDNRIGNFSIQYQGGNPSMRLAEIVSGPFNPANRVMKFWIRQPNVPLGNGHAKGRIQANLYDGPAIHNLFYSIRLYLPHDLDTLKYLPVPVTWFTLMEFWNNPNWNGDPYPFRVTVNLTKPGYTSDSLYFGVHGQTYNGTNFDNVWDTVNTGFYVPTGKWMQIDINYIEGNDQSGRFYMAVKPYNQQQSVIYDLSAWTYHPSDPAPDGLRRFNPFKLYTSGELIDSMTAWGKLTHLYWDDFSVWTDSTAATGNNPVPLSHRFSLYPNPAHNMIHIYFKNQSKELIHIRIFDILGKEILSTQSTDSHHAGISTEYWIPGVYIVQISGKKGLSGRAKFLVK